MPTLIVSVNFEDPSDLDYLRTRILGAVDDVLCDPDTVKRMDGKVGDPEWDIEDDA